MGELIGHVFIWACIAMAVLCVIERLSLCLLLSPLKFRPATKKAKQQWTSDDGRYDYVRHAIVTRGIGKIVAGWTDEYGFQHLVILWGPLKYLPYWFTTRFVYQRTVVKKTVSVFDGTPTDVKFESVTIFPATQAHLIGFRDMHLGELIDFRGCQIVEVFGAGTQNGATGARDLKTWSHHDCPWMVPPDPEDLEPVRAASTTPEDPAPAAS